MKTNLNKIYALTDERYISYENIEDCLEPLFQGGIKILQFRDKNLNDTDFKIQALKIKILCKKYNALFIINDRYKIAIDIEADGIHLGKDDINDTTLENLRKSYNKIIGMSCYGDINQAIKYEKMGIDYVAFGSIFASSTKPNAKKISLDIIKKAKEVLNIPICLIGGITEQNISLLSKYNPDMVAIISDIYESKDIKEKLKRLIKLI
jgi:thiamine-phosphate pyrophosphorylase